MRRRRRGQWEHSRLLGHTLAGSRPGPTGPMGKQVKDAPSVAYRSSLMGHDRPAHKRGRTQRCAAPRFCPKLHRSLLSGGGSQRISWGFSAPCPSTGAVAHPCRGLCEGALAGRLDVRPPPVAALAASVCALAGVLALWGVSPALAVEGHVFSKEITGGTEHALSEPVGLGIEQSTGEVYVADKKNNDVEVFSGSGLRGLRRSGKKVRGRVNSRNRLKWRSKMVWVVCWLVMWR